MYRKRGLFTCKNAQQVQDNTKQRLTDPPPASLSPGSEGNPFLLGSNSKRSFPIPPQQWDKMAMGIIWALALLTQLSTGQPRTPGLSLSCRTTAHTNTPGTVKKNQNKPTSVLPRTRTWEIKTSLKIHYQTLGPSQTALIFISYEFHLCFPRKKDGRQSLIFSTQINIVLSLYPQAKISQDNLV